MALFFLQVLIRPGAELWYFRKGMQAAKPLIGTRNIQLPAHFRLSQSFLRFGTGGNKVFCRIENEQIVAAKDPRSSSRRRLEL